MRDREILNVRCPYCNLHCRVGMSHECDSAPQGCREVEIIWREGQIVALVYGA
jgi:hypothetical protein